MMYASVVVLYRRCCGIHGVRFLMNASPEDIDLIERSSNFTVRLLSSDESWSDERTHHAAHDSVLLPILFVAEECWAYGIDPNSTVFEAAGTLLHKEGRRYKVEISGDSVTNHELFWNAHGGKRGTITIAVPLNRFDATTIFQHCRNAFVFSNYRSGHNTAAITYAQRKIRDQAHLVFCLSGNNGFEWMDVFAPKPSVFSLYAKALELCRAAET